MKHLWPALILIGLLIGLGLYFSTHGTLPTTDVPRVNTASTSVVITDKERVVQDKKVKYEINIIEPVVSGHGSSDAFNTIVSKIFSVAIDEFVSQSINDYEEYKEKVDKFEGSAFSFGLIGNTEVLKDRYVSLVLTKNYYIFYTAHPAHIVETVLYDLDKQKVLGLGDIFFDMPKALSYIAAQSKEQVLQNLNEAGNDGSFEERGLEQEETNFKNFSINNKGMRFIFGEYQVAPYAAGPQEAVFTWEELRPLLTPEFKVIAK